jgi:hypothetical protein
MLLSLRRRGQLLLATCVLAGVVVGSGCGMLVERAQVPSAFLVPAWQHGSSAVAAGSSNRADSGSRAASRSQAGEEATVTRTGSPDRADRHDKAGKQDKRHRGKGKYGKDR